MIDVPGARRRILGIAANMQAALDNPRQPVAQRRTDAAGYAVAAIENLIEEEVQRTLNEAAGG